MPIQTRLLIWFEPMFIYTEQVKTWVHFYEVGKGHNMPLKWAWAFLQTHLQPIHNLSENCSRACFLTRRGLVQQQVKIPLQSSFGLISWLIFTPHSHILNQSWTTLSPFTSLTWTIISSHLQFLYELVLNPTRETISGWAFNHFRTAIWVLFWTHLEPFFRLCCSPFPANIWAVS